MLRAFKLLGISATVVVLAGTTGFFSAAQSVVSVCPSGCDYSSIQAAISAVPEGSTIQVKAGTYQENLTITKLLSLVGEGQDKTIIEGGIAILATKVVSVTRFAVKGSGVRVQDTQTISLLNVAITDGTSDGLSIVNSATVTVRGSTIANSKGSGIVVALGSKAVISASTIRANGGDGISVRASQADLADNLITGNTDCGIRADAASQLSGFGNRSGFRVPEDYKTIQDAVDAWQLDMSPNRSGDSCGNTPSDLITGDGAIIIAPGTYTGPVVIEDKTVALLGAAFNETIVDGRGEFVFSIEGNARARIERLTIQGMAAMDLRDTSQTFGAWA